jgi:hypothetical protein
MPYPNCVKDLICAPHDMISPPGAGNVCSKRKLGYEKHVDEYG